MARSQILLERLEIITMNVEKRKKKILKTREEMIDMEIGKDDPWITLE